jgi:hypothetical protein
LPRGPGGVIRFWAVCGPTCHRPDGRLSRQGLATALILEAAKKLGDPLNGNSSEAAEAEKVVVAADNHVGFCGDCALENPVVRRIGFDRLDDLRRLNEPGDHTHLPVGLGQPFGRALELVSEDAEGLCDDGFGDGKIDLAVSGEVEKLLWLAPNCSALTRTLVSATTRFTNVCGILGRPAR